MALSPPVVYRSVPEVLSGNGPHGASPCSLGDLTRRSLMFDYAIRQVSWLLWFTEALPPIFWPSSFHNPHLHCQTWAVLEIRHGGLQSYGTVGLSLFASLKLPSQASLQSGVDCRGPSTALFPCCLYGRRRHHKLDGSSVIRHSME